MNQVFLLLMVFVGWATGKLMSCTLYSTIPEIYGSTQTEFEFELDSCSCDSGCVRSPSITEREFTEVVAGTVVLMMCYIITVCVSR